MISSKSSPEISFNDSFSSPIRFSKVSFKVSSIIFLILLVLDLEFTVQIMVDEVLVSESLALELGEQDDIISDLMELKFDSSGQLLTRI